MTRHNLEVHLKWLLDQGPSLYPSLSPSARVPDDISASQRLAGNPPIPTPDAPVGQVAAGALDDTQSVQDTFLDDDLEAGAGTETDINMARLLFAPESSRKPRLLSHSKDQVPKTPNGRSSLESPTSNRMILPQTSAKGNISSRTLCAGGELTIVDFKKAVKARVLQSVLPLPQWLRHYKRNLHSTTLTPLSSILIPLI